MTNSATLGSFGDASNAPLVFRNKIINGGMGIDQRNAGATQTFTAAAALAYSVDRWYGYCTGANVTGARVAGTGTQYAYRFTGAASVTAIGFAQRIEAANCYTLAGQTATLSVDLANSLLTTVTWTAYYANTADTFGTLASPTRTQIATGTFTVTSTVTRYATQIAIPSAATTGIEIVFTVGAQTSGTWTIQNVQLEQGLAATPFEIRPFGLEVFLCQRYYEKTFVLETAPANNLGTGIGELFFSAPQAGGGFTNNMYFSYVFKVTKRGTTTVTWYNTRSATAGTLSTYDATTRADSTPVVDSTTTNCVNAYVQRGTLAVGALTAVSEL